MNCEPGTPGCDIQGPPRPPANFPLPGRKPEPLKEGGTSDGAEPAKEVADKPAPSEGGGAPAYKVLGTERDPVTGMDLDTIEALNRAAAESFAADPGAAGGAPETDRAAIAARSAPDDGASAVAASGVIAPGWTDASGGEVPREREYVATNVAAQMEAVRSPGAGGRLGFRALDELLELNRRAMEAVGSYLAGPDPAGLASAGRRFDAAPARDAAPPGRLADERFNVAQQSR